MLEKYLSKTKFDSLDDFKKNFKVIVPENFNFAYDVMDKWAEVWPEGKAIIWVNDEGDEKISLLVLGNVLFLGHDVFEKVVVYDEVKFFVCETVVLGKDFVDFVNKSF